MSLGCLPMAPKQNALNVMKERLRRKISKLRLKATTSGSTTGEKLPLFVTVKSKTPQLFKHIKQFPCTSEIG